MLYEDEIIISKRNEETRKQYSDIRTGVFIGKQLYRFETTLLFGEVISALLPEKFKDMPDEMRKRKYPSEQRPEIVKTNENGTINFTFNFIDDLIKEEKISDILSGFMMAIRRLYPGTLFFENNVEVAGAGYYWMDFKSCAVNGDIYNLFMLTVISEKLLMVTFNCPLREWSDWKPYLMEIMSSVRGARKEEL